MISNYLCIQKTIARCILACICCVFYTTIFATCGDDLNLQIIYLNSETCLEPTGESLVGSSSRNCLLVCEDVPLTYQTINYPGYGYSWSVFGLNASVDDSNPFDISIVYNDPGSYLIVLTATAINDPTCTVTTELCVDVKANPTAYFTSLPPDIGGAITVCDGATVYFFEQAGPDVVTYEWDFGDGTYSNLPNPSHTFNYNPSGYIVTLTVYDECGCGSSYGIEVLMLEEVAFDIECISTVCEKDEATYSVSNINNCPGAIIEWTIEGGSPPNTTGNSVTVVWDSPINGQGIVTAQVKNCPNVCPEPISAIVPILTTSLQVSGSTVVCSGDYQKYWVTPQPGALFEWYLVNSNGVKIPLQNGQNPWVYLTWGYFGNYDICVDVTIPELICPRLTNTFCLPVQVKPGFFVNTVFDNICVGDNLNFNTNVSNTNDLEFTALLAGSSSSINLPVSGNTLLTNTLAAGTYWITATSLSGTYCNKETFSLTVKDLIVFDFSTIDFGVVCPGAEQTYTINNPNGYQLNWQVTGGSIVFQSENLLVINWTSGAPAYSVSLQLEDPSDTLCPSSLHTYNLIAVDPNGIAIQTVGSSYSDCSMEFSLQGNYPAGIEYEWSISDPVAGSIVSGNGTDMVLVEWMIYDGPVVVTVNSDCFSLSTTIDLSEPIIVPIGPFTLCQGEVQDFTTTVLNADPLDVDFTYQLNSNPSQNNPIIPFSTPGVHNVTITASVCNGTSVTTDVVVTVLPIPDVHVTALNGFNMCLGFEILIPSLQSDPSNGSTTYTYDWHGLTTGTNDIAIVFQAGVYPLTVSDGVCSVTIQVEVGECPGGPTGICNGPSVQATLVDDCTGEFNFELSGITPQSGDEWIFGDGQGATGTTSANHVYEHSGFYTVSYFDASQNCITSNQVQVPLVADFDYDFSCGPNGLVLNLWDQSDYLMPPTFTWSVNGTPFNGSSATYNVPLGASSFNVSLEIVAMDYSGNTVQCILTETVIAPTAPDASFNLDPPGVVGTVEMFSLIDQSQDITNYFWEIFGPNGFYTSSHDPNFLNYTFTQSGQHAVSLTITDAMGCTDTKSQTIYIFDALNVDIDVIKHCDYYELTAIPDAPIFQINFDWYDQNNPGTSLGNTQTIFYTPPPGQPIQIEVEAFNFFTSAVAYADVLLNPFPEVEIEGATDYCAGDKMCLNGYLPGDYTYAWYDQNMSPVSVHWEYCATAVDQIYTLEVTDIHTNCVYTQTIDIDVYDNPKPFTIDQLSCDPYVLTILNPEAGVVYYWDNGDIGTQSTYYSEQAVTVIAVNANGCVREESFFISSTPDISNIAVGCYCFPQSQVIWNLSPVGMGPYYYYVYNVQTGLIYSGANPMLAINQSGSYYVVVEDLNFGCTTTSDIIDINLSCSDCDVEIAEISTECGEIYNGNQQYVFTVGIDNFGPDLNIVDITSPDATVVSYSPSVIGANQYVNLNGTFVLTNSSAIFIEFTVLGQISDAEYCEFTFEVEIPVCQECQCEFKIEEISYSCLGIDVNTNITTYAFEAVYQNYSCELIDLYFSELGDFQISLDDDVMPANSTGVLTGLINVNTDKHDCFEASLIAYEATNMKKCEQTLEFCPKGECVKQEKCPEEIFLLEYVIYPREECVNGLGHLVYDFTFLINSPLLNPDVSIFFNGNQTNNQINNLQISSSGNLHQITGTIIDASIFDEEFCLDIILFNPGTNLICKIEDVCWKPREYCIEARQIANNLSSRSTAEMNRISVYPNPASDLLKISLIEEITHDTKVVLYDEMGRVILSDNIHVGQKDLELNISELNEGVYILSIFDKTTNLKFIKKVIKL